MTMFYAAEARRRANSYGPLPVDGSEQGARLRRYRCTIELDAPYTGETTQGTAILIADTVSLARVPIGSVFAFGIINSSVSLGSSTISIGIAGTPAKYRALAVHTAVDTPTLFGLNAPTVAAPLPADEEIILTVAAANMPTSDNRVCIDLYFAAP